jgi:hypothetical protein
MKHFRINLRHQHNPNSNIRLIKSSIRTNLAINDDRRREMEDWCGEWRNVTYGARRSLPVELTSNIQYIS